jgi:hypothetical protein
MLRYTLNNEVVPYEREFKRWAQETSASTWRDTKVYVFEGRRERRKKKRRG